MILGLSKKNISRFFILFRFFTNPKEASLFKVAYNAALLVVRTAANISPIASIPGALLPLMCMLPLLLMLTLLWSMLLYFRR